MILISHDVTAIPEDAWYIQKPALYIVAKRDFVSRAELWTGAMTKYVVQLEIDELNTGHWAQMEATVELNGMIERWVRASIKS